MLDGHSGRCTTESCACETVSINSDPKRGDAEAEIDAEREGRSRDLFAPGVIDALRRTGVGVDAGVSLRTSRSGLG